MRSPLLILIILTAAALSSCELFEPREPEPPITGGSAFEPPTSPSIVLKNLQNALLFANALDYRKCFSDSSDGLTRFRFVPAPDGESVAPGRFSDWSIDEEEEYIRTIFSEMQEGAIASLTLTPPDVTTTPIGDSIRFTADYAVSFPHTRQGVEREAFGRLIFTMRLSDRNEWAITRWQDLSIDDRPTWSLIKARFSN